MRHMDMDMDKDMDMYSAIVQASTVPSMRVYTSQARERAIILAQALLHARAAHRSPTFTKMMDPESLIVIVIRLRYGCSIINNQRLLDTAVASSNNQRLLDTAVASSNNQRLLAKSDCAALLALEK